MNFSTGMGYLQNQINREKLGSDYEKRSSVQGLDSPKIAFFKVAEV